jgi:hypothetical protein
MFSRVVAVRTKEGKARQLAKTIQEKILPILESQPGFVDEVVLYRGSHEVANLDL